MSVTSNWLLRKWNALVCWVRGHVFFEDYVVRGATQTTIRVGRGRVLTTGYHGLCRGDKVRVDYLVCARCGRHRGSQR